MELKKCQLNGSMDAKEFRQHAPRSCGATERLVESDLGRELIEPIECPGVLGDPARLLKLH